MTTWIINSAVIPAGGYGTYEYRPATRADLRDALRREHVSRIGYEETARLIEQWTGIMPAHSREPSNLEPGDVAYVVRLRYRVDPSRKAGMSPAADARDADWEIGRLERNT
jgi:hypothetical protein